MAVPVFWPHFHARKYLGLIEEIPGGDVNSQEGAERYGKQGRPPVPGASWAGLQSRPGYLKQGSPRLNTCMISCFIFFLFPIQQSDRLLGLLPRSHIFPIASFVSLISCNSFFLCYLQECTILHLYCRKKPNSPKKKHFNVNMLHSFRIYHTDLHWQQFFSQMILAQFTSMFVYSPCFI
jgi:hypothetical protein